jgi:hypothetical protein
MPLAPNLREPTQVKVAAAAEPSEKPGEPLPEKTLTRPALLTALTWALPLSNRYMGQPEGSKTTA